MTLTTHPVAPHSYLTLGVVMLMVGFLGALTASALAVLVERTRANERVVSAHSRCSCGRELRLSEVIPLYGFLRVRGRARCCGARIPRRYFVAELLTGLSWALACVLAPLMALGVVIGSLLLVTTISAGAVTGDRSTR